MTQQPARLQTLYEKQIRPDLQKQFGYSNPMQVPRLVKISVNMGVGEGVSDSGAAERAAEEMALITGQKPVITKARKAEATFKLRAGLAIGCKVTLRRQRMYEFLDRLVNTALPRVRDFRGLSTKSFDEGGCYSMGLTEQIVFPEIDYDKIDGVRGMDITIVTTAKTKEEAQVLLAAFNLPFRKQVSK